VSKKGWAIQLANYCSDDETYLKPMKRAVHRFYQSVTDEICSSPENETIGSNSVGYLMMCADYSREFVTAREKARPATKPSPNAVNVGAIPHGRRL
jgi:hypothetical protein